MITSTFIAKRKHFQFINFFSIQNTEYYYWMMCSFDWVSRILVLKKESFILTKKKECTKSCDPRIF